MGTTESKTVYFEKGGRENTDAALSIAKERADALGIKDIIVASYSGFTGARAVEIFAGCSVTVVNGLQSDRMEPEYRRVIEEGNAKILSAGHAFGMLGRAVRNKFSTIQSDEIIAHVLRLFSQGVKVAAEITCMATDAGIIKPGTQVIAIGGSGQGADSAAVIKATNTQTFFDTRFLEILCKPRT
ncbi:MAG: hypothetical protein CMN78_02355 [Spirochaetales bacterium]|nr:hypothetical protein [Spirochaetales bacterium]